MPRGAGGTGLVGRQLMALADAGHAGVPVSRSSGIDVVSGAGLDDALAGPQTEDLVDMARRTLAARGDPTRLVASWRDGPFGVASARRRPRPCRRRPRPISRHYPAGQSRTT
jgi:hypothetical protein